MHIYIVYHIIFIFMINIKLNITIKYVIHTFNILY